MYDRFNAIVRYGRITKSDLLLLIFLLFFSKPYKLLLAKRINAKFIYDNSGIYSGSPPIICNHPAFRQSLDHVTKLMPLCQLMIFSLMINIPECFIIHAHSALLHEI